MGSMRTLDKEVADRLRLELTALQGDRTDSEMATLLGCTRPHYWNIKHDRRRASYTLVKRAARVFPSLSIVVMRDLSAESERAAS